LLIFFHISNNVYFLYQDNFPLIADNYIHHQNSVNTFNKLKEGDISNLINQFVNFPCHQIVFLPNFFFYFVFGTSEDVTAFQGTIFLVILIIATYLLGKELFNKDVGLLAAVFISFSPIVLAISKVPYDDIDFVALFTLTLYFFLKSKKFSDIKYTWFFNISLALTILSKFGSIFVILILVSTYSSLILLFHRKELKDYLSNWKKRNIVHFFISFFIAMILPFRYYSIHLIKRTTLITSSYNIKEFYYSNILNALFDYIKTINLNFGHVFIFFLFIISFAFFLVFSKKKKLLLISLVLGANIFHLSLLLFFSFLFEDVHRHLVFIKPTYLLIISFFFVEFCYNVLLKSFKKFNLKTPNKKKYFIFVVVLSILLLIPFTLLYNYSGLINRPSTHYPLFEKYYPTKLNYDVRTILNEISNKHDDNITLFIFSPQNNFLDIFNTYVPSEYININVVTLSLEDQSIEFMDEYVKRLEHYSYFDNYKNIDKSFKYHELINFDYVILPGKENIEEFGDYQLYFDYHSKIYDYILNNKQKFQLFKEINLNDVNVTLLIYKIR